jgi:hypothetical protein
MDLMHTLHFGYPIGGEPARRPARARAGRGAEFGSYDPVEHIDNPGGLTGADVNNAQGGHADASDQRRRRHPQAYAEIDQRYKAAVRQDEGGAEEGRERARATPKRRSTRSRSTSRASRSTCRPAGPS